MLIEGCWQTLVVDGSPVGLVGLPEDIHYGALEGRGGGDLLQDDLNGGEILLDCLNHDGDGVLEKEDHAVQVQLGAEQIEEHILAVTLVELRTYVLQFIEHGEGR